MGMMALQYFGLGAWAVPLTLYLQAPPSEGGMGFAPTQAGLIYSTFAFGGFVAPFFVGVLADRYFAAQKLLGALHAMMAVLLAASAYWCDAHDGANADPDRASGPLFLFMLGYAILCQISLALTNTIGFRNLADGGTFGYVRLMGTFGWILSATTAGWLLTTNSASSLTLATAASVAMAAYSRMLPHTPPQGTGRTAGEVVGLPALRLFRDRAFVAFAVAAFLGNAMNQFYNLFTPPYLKELGVRLDLGPLGHFGPEVIMTLGQWLEMLCMAASPWLVARLGLKPVMLLGLAGWALRAFVLYSGVVPLIVFVALPLHGFSYAFFGMLGAVFVDREAPRQLRAGAQGLNTFLVSGPAVLVGNHLAGRIVEANRVGTVTDWPTVWLVPTLGCSAAVLVFLLFFREPVPEEVPADGRLL